MAQIYVLAIVINFAHHLDLQNSKTIASIYSYISIYTPKRNLYSYDLNYIRTKQFVIKTSACI